AHVYANIITKAVIAERLAVVATGRRRARNTKIEDQGDGLPLRGLLRGVEHRRVPLRRAIDQAEPRAIRARGARAYVVLRIGGLRGQRPLPRADSALDLRELRDRDARARSVFGHGEVADVAERRRDGPRALVRELIRV